MPSSVVSASDTRLEDGEVELARFERFCAGLTLVQGRPLILEPFQRRFMLDYFLGTRETLVLISKKNGKTTLLAALALYHLCATAEAECVIGASSRDQASLLLDQAIGFVTRAKGLRRLVVPKRGFREIRSLKDMGRVRVLAADVDHADGVIPTLALVDELGRHRKPDLYGVFRDGLGPRDGQMITISTAGDLETSPLGVMRQAALKLPLESEGNYTYARTEDFAMHEWRLHDEDQVDDMAAVKTVNPASWQTIKKLKERHDSPSTLAWQWARFACGIWVAAEGSWLDPADWWAAEVDAKIEPGDRITIGFDGSRFGDATALIGCRLEDGLLQVLGCWEAPAGAPPDWEVPASAVDARLSAVMEQYSVVRGYFDPPLWQSEIDAWARDFGDTAVMRYWTNRARMLFATERFRTDLVAGTLRHAKPTVSLEEALTRHVLNAQVTPSRGGYALVKGGRNAKIDAAVAAVLAWEARGDALDHDETPSGAVFF